MSAPPPLPQADALIISQALSLLFTPDDVIEVRALSLRGRNRTDAGYFDPEHRSDLISEAVRMNGNKAAVYVNLNPIEPQLLSRYANRMQEGAISTATDANVTRRRWLLLDFDPVRPKDTSATDFQVEAAHVIARECYEYLRGEGWPEPVCAYSGNGYHLDYPIDLPNNEASRELIKAVLKALAARFDSDAVKVDQSVFNAGRIIKLYGTVANKGDCTASAPWRLSRILRAPERTAVVTIDQLTALVPVQQQRSTKTPGASTFDLAGFLSRLGIGYREDTHEGRERYKLDHCPFNSEHGFGEAAIFRDSAGVLGFRCLHNTCTDKRWKDVRELIDGPRESRTGRTAGFEGKGRSEAGAPAPETHEWPLGLDLEVLAEREPQAPRSIMDGVPIGYATGTFGHGGAGKSQIELLRAVCIASGVPFCGLCLTRCRVLLISCEDRADILHWRLTRICSHLGVDLAALRGWLEIIDLVGRDSILFAPEPHTGKVLTAAFGILDHRMREYGSEVLIIDGITDVFGGNENNRNEVKRFVNTLLALIPADTGALILVGHVNKATAGGSSSEGYSGSTGWHNSMRARWYLYPELIEGDDGERATRTGKLIFELQKSNHGEVGAQIVFEWNAAARLFVGRAKGGTTRFDQRHRDRMEQQGILVALQACEAAAIIVPATMQGPRTAFHVLSQRPEFPDSMRAGKPGIRRFWRNIEQLRQMHAIEESEYRRTNRHLGAQITLTTEGCVNAPYNEIQYDANTAHDRDCVMRRIRRGGI